MKRFVTLGGTLAVSLLFAACGGGGGEGGATSASGAPAEGAMTVGVKQVGGIGSVLVNASGQALYTADVEADGKVRCTGACTSFWLPLTVDSGAPTAAAGIGRLDVIKRPDGARQVTVGGKPLYTFSEDRPGHVEGDGFSDDFDGRQFTWSAALAGGKAAAGTSSGGSQAPPGY